MGGEGELEARVVGQEMKVSVEDGMCRNPTFGLATKARGLQGYGPKGSP